MMLRSGKIVNENKMENKIVNKSERWYDLVDQVNVKRDEEEEYKSFLKNMLGATKIEIISNEFGIIHLKALAYPTICMKRLRMRLQGWMIRWKQDYDADLKTL